MCYSKALKADKITVEEFYGAKMQEEFEPKYYETAFDYGYDPIVRVQSPKEILMYRWGLLPDWEKDLAKIQEPAGTLNCKSEAMYITKSFKDSAEKAQRCLIPASHFLESHWSSVDKANPKHKTPFKIFSPEQEIFSIAGLWNDFHDKNTGRTIPTYTVLTTSSLTNKNELMTYIHNNPKNPHRMPVIITKEFERDWLNANLNEKEVLELCSSMHEGFLKAYTISREVTKKNLTSYQKNNPNIDKPVEYKPEELDESAAPPKEPKPKPARSKKAKTDNGTGSLFG